jgi:Na+/H+-dicarboxylate symporter
MKLWLKYLLATVLGILLGFILPLNGGDTEVFFATVYTYVLHVGRYLVFPLVFFGLTIGTYELWLEKKFFPVYGRMLGYSMISAVAASAIAAIFVAVFSPERVPIIIEEAELRSLPGLGEQLQQIFPKNLFAIFSNSGDFLLPVFVFAVILGLGLLNNRSVSAPVIDVLESLSRIIHNMNRIMLQILSFGLFFMMAYRTSQLRGMADLELFNQLLLVVIGAAVFVIFLLIPLLLYLAGNRTRNPYLWLFGTLPAALSALLSGDLYFGVSSAEGTVSNNMGVQPKAGSAMIPLGAIFSRSGTALVTTISFILILRSYSSLDVTLLQFFWIMGSSILISFMLGTVPGNAMVVSLSVISAWYGQGLEEGFLILLPIAPILTALAVLLDSMVILTNIQLVADHEKLAEQVSSRDFL